MIKYNSYKAKINKRKHNFEAFLKYYNLIHEKSKKINNILSTLNSNFLNLQILNLNNFYK